MENSAFLGQPPNTEEDYWIVKGTLRSFGMPHADPHKGLRAFPRRPPPNQYHFETKGPGIIAGMTVSIAIMIAITGTRLGIRYFKKRLKWGWDDWFIIPGVILAITWPALQIAIVQYGGGGKHIYDVTYHEYNIFHWLGVIDIVVFFVSVGIVKLSITCFNLRITGLTSKTWKIAHRTFIGLLVLYVSAAFFTLVFHCRPPRAFFDLIAAGKLPEPPQCTNVGQYAMAHSIFHIVTDFCLLSVPIIVVWKVQMHWTTKIRLYFVFSIGAMSCIGSVMRLRSEPGADFTYQYTGLITWSLVDLTFGVMVASLPVLSALLPGPVKGRGRGRSGFSGFSAGLPHISTGTQASSNLGSEGAKHLQSKESQEGILREDTVELGFQTTGPLDERDRTSGLGLHANNDVHVSPSPLSTYPMTTYPSAAVLPNRPSENGLRFGK